MSTKLLRNTILFLGTLALTCMLIVAYGNYETAANADTTEGNVKSNNLNTEMPWETLSRRLIGAVSF